MRPHLRLPLCSLYKMFLRFQNVFLRCLSIVSTKCSAHTTWKLNLTCIHLISHSLFWIIAISKTSRMLKPAFLSLFAIPWIWKIANPCVQQHSTIPPMCAASQEKAICWVGLALGALKPNLVAIQLKPTACWNHHGELKHWNLAWLIGTVACLATMQCQTQWDDAFLFLNSLPTPRCLCRYWENLANVQCICSDLPHKITFYL